MNIDIIQCCHDDALLGSAFQDKTTWSAWFTAFKVLDGLSLDAEDMEVFRRCTGRREPPKGPFSEAWFLSGRRSGKSFALAVLLVHRSCFRDYTPYLAPGERVMNPIFAVDRRQARQIFRYAAGIIKSNDLLRSLVALETKERIELTTRVDIEIGTTSWRAGGRGPTVAHGSADEASFWRDDETLSNPANRIFDALRPSLATIPGSTLVCASSVYAKRGPSYEAWEKYWGHDDADVLVWWSDSLTMNPSLSRSVISRAMDRDATSAKTEFYSEWRDDSAAAFAKERVEASATLPENQAPQDGPRYTAFVDVSGGRKDWTALSIGHREGKKIVVDLVKGWKPPFDPDSIVRQIADLCREYRVSKIVGDRYGAAWVQSSFEREGIKYIPAEKPKSDLYLNLEGPLNTGRVVFPNHERLIGELTDLERRPGASGKDNIDHPRTGSDDLANSLAGCVYELDKRSGGGIVSGAKIIRRRGFCGPSLPF